MGPASPRARKRPAAPARELLGLRWVLPPPLDTLCPQSYITRNIKEAPENPAEEPSSTMSQHRRPKPQPSTTTVQLSISVTYGLDAQSTTRRRIGPIQLPVDHDEKDIEDAVRASLQRKHPGTEVFVFQLTYQYPYSYDPPRLL